MKKHIIIVASHYPPHVGGIETYSISLAREFHLRKYDVSVITTNTNYSEFKTEEEGVTVYRLSSWHLLNKRFPLPYSLSQLIDIGSQVFVSGSVCIIQTRFFPLSLIAGILCQLRSIKSIIVEHGSGHFAYPSFVTTKLASFYEHIVTSMLNVIARPTYVAVSQAAANWLTHFGLKAKTVVGNASLSSRTSRNMIRDPDWIPGQARNDSKIILYAGRLIKEKGIRELITGFKQFAAIYPAYRLVIIGEGELASEVINETTDNGTISYVGALPHTETINWIKNASVYVHPSYYPEGLPTSLLEAGTYAVPVISSLAGGISEIIQHNKTGYVLNKVTAENIKDALTYMTSHSKQASEMGHSLYLLVKEQYNWSVVVERFETLC